MPATEEIDFFTGEETKDNVEATAEQRPVRKNAAPQLGFMGDDAPPPEESAEESLPRILGPMPEEDEVEEPPAKKEPKPKPKEKEVPAPTYFRPEVLQLAASFGVDPSRYRTEAELEVAALRRLAKDQYDRLQSRETPVESPKEEKLPEFTFDEDTDPAVRKALEQSNAYWQKRFEQMSGQYRKDIDSLKQEQQRARTEYEQAADRQARDAEAKIVRMIDEEVATWGDEFTELIGVPSQSWSQPGTPQYAELQKIREFVMDRKEGYILRTGNVPSSEEIMGFFRQAKGALYPELLQSATKRKIGESVKKQRGGAALRPGKANVAAPAEQTEDAAKQAIGEYMDSQGIGLWQKRQSA